MFSSKKKNDYLYLPLDTADQLPKMSQPSLDQGLYQAAAVEDLRDERSLPDPGANPNVERFEYISALQAAARRGSVELVQLLLDRCVQIDAQGGYHCSALIRAAQYGNLDIMRLFVNVKANLGLRGIYDTALAVSRDKYHGDVVQVLLTTDVIEWRPGNVDLDRRFQFRFG